MTGELESTTSTRVRELAMEVEREQEESKLPQFLRNQGPSKPGLLPGPTKLEEMRAMVGAPVAKWIIKNRLGKKMSGAERWTAADKEFELFSGLAKGDQGYEKEARRKPQRLIEKEELRSNPGVSTHLHDFTLDF